MTITRKGKELLSKTKEVTKPSTLEGPQVKGYAQRDNKFLCGACGSALDIHSRRTRAKRLDVYIMWTGLCGCVPDYAEAVLVPLGRLHGLELLGRETQATSVHGSPQDRSMVDS